MFYYSLDQEEKYIIKQSVEIDTEKLKKLKVEIINNCAEIKHNDYKSTSDPNYFDALHIRNYKKTSTGEIKDNFDGDLPIYHYEYDEYIDPTLVTLIDNLLSEKNNSIKVYDIFNYKPRLDVYNKSTNIKEIKNRQNLIIAKLSKSYPEDITKELSELNKLQNQINDLTKENSNLEKISEYYDKVLECINLTEVDRIELEKVIEIQNFFEKATQNEKQYSQEVNKVLQKK